MDDGEAGEVGEGTGVVGCGGGGGRWRIKGLN